MTEPLSARISLYDGNANSPVILVLASFKFKKGDYVMVDEDGKEVKYEIVSALDSAKRGKGIDELLYEARNLSTGSRRTVSQEDILRHATPVDNSSELFEGKN